MKEEKENLPHENGRVFTPLKIYEDLNMSREQIYRHLQKYQLCGAELKKNKFPVAGDALDTLVSSSGQVKRKCYRCLQHFEVSLEGQYLTKGYCLFHPQRKLLTTANQGRVHLCCMKPPGSPGCSKFPVHVCGDPILNHTVIEEIHDKTQVHSDQLCGVYALDCEMIYTGVGQQVAKIGLVDIEGSTVLESYIKPDNEVVDYCTTFSGITPTHLKDVTTTLRDIQVFLDKLLNQHSILIGHGLDNDLRVLRISHKNIVDTSVVFPRPDGTKKKLKDLARDHLDLVIQNDPSGHDCIEDARTCMALVLHKIKTDKEFLAVSNNRLNDTRSPNLMSCNQSMHFGQFPTYESLIYNPYALGSTIFSL